MFYRICNDFIAILAADHLRPVPICTTGSETRYTQIQCNTNTSVLLSLYHQTVEHPARRCLPDGT